MIWMVALGSALGGAARYQVGVWFQRIAPAAFPFGTLAINVVGSMLLGFVLRAIGQEPGVAPYARTFLALGVCGGFTTFSAFSYETLVLLEQGDNRRALVYVLGSVVLSIAAVGVGVLLGRVVTPLRPLDPVSS